jgi:hypothetical protein
MNWIRTLVCYALLGTSLVVTTGFDFANSPAVVCFARTVTTIVNADSEAEAIVKAQNRYPKCRVTGVRKSGNHYIVTLKCK